MQGGGNVRSCVSLLNTDQLLEFSLMASFKSYAVCKLMISILHGSKLIKKKKKELPIMGKEMEESPLFLPDSCMIKPLVQQFHHSHLWPNRI